MRKSDFKENAVVMVTRNNPPGLRLRGYYGAMGIVSSYRTVNFGRGPEPHACCNRDEVRWSFHPRDLVLLERG